MYLEQRVLKVHRVQLVIELLVVLVGQARRCFLPSRVCVVDDARHFLFHTLWLFLLATFAIVHFCELRLAVHPFALFAEADGYRHKAAVFFQELKYAVLLKELLAVVGNVQYDVGAALFFLALFHLEFRTAVATPVHCRSVFPTLGLNFNLVGHHKCRVEPKSEMAYQVLLHILILVKEVVGTTEGYLVDVLVNLLLRHTDTAVADNQFFLVNLHLDGKVAQLTFELAARRQGFQLLRGIYSIGNQLAQKNLVIRIKEFLNDRKDVFGLNVQIALHISFLFLVFIFLLFL